MAEGALSFLASMQGVGDFFDVESAGTVGYQSGATPDYRAVRAAGRYGIDISTIRARCLDDLDLDRFDRIFAMDAENHRDLLDLLEGRAHQVHFMTDFSAAHAGTEIADPYYGDEEGFDRTMQLIMHCASGILETMLVSGTFDESGDGIGSAFQFPGYGDGR